jgi:hypothetical protein
VTGVHGVCPGAPWTAMECHRGRRRVRKGVAGVFWATVHGV